MVAELCMLVLQPEHVSLAFQFLEHQLDLMQFFPLEPDGERGNGGHARK